VGRHVVDALEADGHEFVAMSRAIGVDLVTGIPGAVGSSSGRGA
jgi:hypothetical protein